MAFPIELTSEEIPLGKDLMLTYQQLYEEASLILHSSNRVTVSTGMTRPDHKDLWPFL